MDAENIDELEAVIGAEASGLPHRPGLERPHASGSRRRQFSCTLRSGQHQAQELPGYIREWMTRERENDSRGDS